MARLHYGHIENNGVRIHYYRTGEEKPPVILLHGITDNGLCWSRFAMYLEPDFDVIMIDARAHGLSDAPESGYGPEKNAEDVAALIEHLEIIRPSVIGHSMGADTAAHLAASYPHLVGKIVLEDPPWRSEDPLPEDTARMRSEWAARIAELRTKSLDELLEECRRVHPEWEEESDRFQWAKAKQQVKPQAAENVGAVRKPWREVAKQITCPVMLVTAEPERGAIVTQQVAKEASKGWKRGSGSVFIAGAGHNIRREQFTTYLRIVSDFLFSK